MPCLPLFIRDFVILIHIDPDIFDGYTSEILSDLRDSFKITNCNLWLWFWYMYLACTFDDLPLELLALYEALQALVLKQLRESYYHKDTIMSYSTSNTRSLLSRTWIVICFDVKRGENGLSSLTCSLEEV
ncbi:unnamed protein product [Cuscuta campestris]|uniref:Uncharacterized protein n=1 Tax=Cuscuta campestris TaxID=132261 RepID=A0A484M1N3_9ASTE|nr:unnamed protein product [Cuscuta campestris]